jgi:hypothetical protein
LTEGFPKPDLQIIAAVTARSSDNAELSVRLRNQSEHALRLPVRGFICSDKPGWISAHFEFTAPADQSRSEMESGSQGCGISVGEPAEFDIVDAARMWKLLLPGESLEIHGQFSNLIPGSLKRGSYTFRAVYSGKDATEHQQEKLTAAGISTPLGRYESNEVVLNIEYARR